MKRFALLLGILLAKIIYAQDLESGLKLLSEQIAHGMIGENKQKIAVIEFSDLDGNTTELGKYVSEELTTKLFMTNKFNVIERQLLNKILDEHKLKFTGIIDEATAKELGKILGVDAICSGTITDLVSNIKINARLISTESGALFSVAAVQIAKDEVISKLMNKPQKIKELKEPNEPIGTTGTVFFRENFNKYDIGDPVPSWGSNLAVVLQKIVGKKYISAQDERVFITIGQNIQFPQNFSFEFEITGGCVWGNREPFHLILVNSGGEELKIWISACASLSVQLPGTDKIEVNGYNYETQNTIKVTKKNGVIKVFSNGTFTVSGSYEQFNNIVAFKLASYLGNYGFGNFIGLTQ